MFAIFWWTSEPLVHEDRQVLPRQRIGALGLRDSRKPTSKVGLPVLLAEPVMGPQNDEEFLCIND